MSEEKSKVSLFSFFKKSNPNRPIFRIYSSDFFTARKSLMKHRKWTLADYQSNGVDFNERPKENKDE